MPKPTLEDAIQLALNAHRGVNQYNGQPYILHPLAVMQQVHTEHEQMAAVLHDVVEDSEVTLDDLREQGYPPAVVTAVDALTRRDDETYEEFVLRAKADPIARRVKMADIQHNIDVRRLNAVTAKDAERLERYRRAWFVLLED